MGVRTHMTTGGDIQENPDGRLAHAAVAGAGEMLSPLDVADVVLDAVGEGRFLALPHPERRRACSRARPPTAIAGSPACSASAARSNEGRALPLSSC